jgi:hypothetical protein
VESIPEGTRGIAAMTRRSKRLSARDLALVGSLILAWARTASASEAGESRAARETMSISTSVVTPLFDAYYLETKVRASGSFAAIFNASYLTLENHDWTDRAGTVGAGVDYFFQGDALHRWYVEGIGEIWFSSWRHGSSGEVAPVGLGYAGIALVGYQFVFHHGPVIDLGAGAVAFHLPSVHVENASGSVSSESLTKLYPAAKVDVGWAF